MALAVWTGPVSSIAQPCVGIISRGPVLHLNLNIDRTVDEHCYLARMVIVFFYPSR